MLEKESFEIYLQKRSFDCGAGAAGILLKNFGYRVNYPNLIQALEVSRRNGTRASRLEGYFYRRGFPAYSKNNAFISDLRWDLDHGRLPIVAFQGSGTKREMARYEGGHYAVPAIISKRYVYLLDPGIDKDFGDGVGWQRLSIPEFRARWYDMDKENGKEIYYTHWMLSVGKK